MEISCMDFLWHTGDLLYESLQRQNPCVDAVYRLRKLFWVRILVDHTYSPADNSGISASTYLYCLAAKQNTKIIL